MTSDLCDVAATEQRRMIGAKEVSARELLEAHLARIDDRNPDLNAIVALDPEVGQARAAVVDQIIADGADPGPLAGLVTAHKDLLDTADFPTTYGSTPFADHRPTSDSIVVSRMKEAGAVAVGKTNVPEFGTGSHTFNDVYGTTANPYDNTRTAGGSSGGAAAALAAGMVAIADGSDFGGSLRNPGAWNNVVGFRPSAGVVPVSGPGNAWHPMPVVGPMARNVDDAALLFAVLSQPDSVDPIGRGLADAPSRIAGPDRPLRVAWSTDLGGLPIQPEILETVGKLRPLMDELGWAVTDDEPDFSGSEDTFITLRAFSYASRAEALAPVIDQIKTTVRDEMERGSKLKGTDVSAAFFQLKVLWDRAHQFFEDYDLLVAPVTQVMPFPADQEYPTEIAGVQMSTYVEWMMSCCRITAFGLPALSLPAGFSNGLPVGVQLIGRPNGDIDLLRAAKAVETAQR